MHWPKLFARSPRTELPPSEDEVEEPGCGMRLLRAAGDPWPDLASVAARASTVSTAATLDAIVYDFTVHGYAGTTHRRRVPGMQALDAEVAKSHLQVAGLALFAPMRGYLPARPLRIHILAGTPTHLIESRYGKYRDLVLADLKGHAPASHDPALLPWWLWARSDQPFTDCLTLADTCPVPAAAVELIANFDTHLTSIDDARVFTHVALT